MLSKELVAASTTTLVLSILSEGDHHGYALIRRVNELSAGHVHWSEACFTRCCIGWRRRI